MREKRGNLDAIKIAQLSGSDLTKVKKVDETNKDLATMAEIIKRFPTIDYLISGVQTDEEIIAKLRDIFRFNTEYAFLAYKLMWYILATNRSSIRQLSPEDAVQMPYGFKEYFDQYILIS
jgi:hypothetical protein